MSDLVRGIDRPVSPAPPPPAPASAAAAPPAPRAPDSADRPAAATPVDPPEALFSELQRQLLDVRDVVRSGGTAPWSRLEALVDRCVTSLTASADLFWAVSNPPAPPGTDYVAFHQARVAVLAVRLAATLDYDARRLRGLGLAGALMDVGLWELPERILRHVDALSPDEAAAYRTHPRRSADRLRAWGAPDEHIATAVLHHHEREHGQGYPGGLQGAAIDPDAKVLGLADTYAALTVPPPSRPRLRPHEAIRDILKTRQDAFSPPLVKALLSEVSVFPPGTVVRLSTDEIGRVIAVNRHHPLRPCVEIVADGKGQRLAVPKTVDLSEAPFLYITGAVTEGSR